MLKGLSAELGQLEGIVRGRDSSALPGARVGFGPRLARTDEEGRFAFEYDRADPPRTMTAASQGLRPLVLRRPDEGWPDFVEITIADEPLSITGVVYDADGTPLAGAEVWIPKTTILGNEDSWISVERIVTGSRGLQHDVRTDEQGRFTISGLLERGYDLLALDRRTACLLEAGTFAAGSRDVEIRFPADALHPELRGQLVDRLGRPVPDVRVSVETPVQAAEAPGRRYYYNVRNGSSTVSDAEGFFLLESVPRLPGSELSLNSEDVLDAAQSLAIPRDLSVDVWKILVHLRCQVRIDQPEGLAHSADEFELLDQNEQAVRLVRNEKGQITYLHRAPLLEGRSELLDTSDGAVTLVLFREGKEISRSAISLTPGERTVIQ